MNQKKVLLHLLRWKKTKFLWLVIIQLIDVLHVLLGSKDNYLGLVLSILNLGFFFYFIGGLRDKDFFSLKYVQSLPIGRHQVMQLISLNVFFGLLPGLILLAASAAGQSDRTSDFSPAVFFLFKIMIAIPILAYCSVGLSIFIFYQQIYATRAPFLKLETWGARLSKFRNICLIFGPILFFLSLLKSTVSYLSEYILLFIPFLLLSALGILVIFYWWAFRQWRDEKLSYGNPDYRIWRDVPLTLAGITLMVLSFNGVKERSVPSMYGSSPMIKAMIENDNEAFRRLIGQKKINEPSSTGFTPIMAAAHEGDFNRVKMFLQLKANLEGKVNRPNDGIHHKMDLFMLAVDGKNPKIVELFLSEENANTKNGRFSALHAAAFNCSPEIMDMLIEKGASLNELNDKGQTPLHVAAFKGCFAGVVSLVDAGANLSIKDKMGHTAETYVEVGKSDLLTYFARKSRAPAGRK